MDVALLGPLEIRDGSTEIAPGGRRQRRLLARLGLEAGRGVSFDELESAVWDDDPPLTARHTIAAHVSRLRQPGPGDLDLGRRLPAGHAHRHPGPRAARARGTCGAGDRAATRHGPAARGPGAVAGPPLPGARSRRAGADRGGPPRGAGRRACARTCWPPSSTTARDGALVATARALTAEQPYRERRWELLMLALYRAGRQAEALDVYAECRRRLVDDLGYRAGPRPAAHAAGGAGPGPGTRSPGRPRVRRREHGRGCPARRLA